MLTPLSRLAHDAVPLTVARNDAFANVHGVCLEEILPKLGDRLIDARHARIDLGQILLVENQCLLAANRAHVPGRRRGGLSLTA